MAINIEVCTQILAIIQFIGYALKTLIHFCLMKYNSSTPAQT